MIETIVLAVALLAPNLLILLACIICIRINKNTASVLMLVGTIVAIVLSCSHVIQLHVQIPMSLWRICFYGGMIVSFIGAVCFASGFYMSMRSIQKKHNQLIHSIAGSARSE